MSSECKKKKKRDELTLNKTHSLILKWFDIKKRELHSGCLDKASANRAKVHRTDEWVVSAVELNAICRRTKSSANNFEFCLQVLDADYRATSTQRNFAISPRPLKSSYRENLSRSLPLLRKTTSMPSFHFYHIKSIKSGRNSPSRSVRLLNKKANIIFSFMCLLFILMMELFMYFQIWNLWYYFLCFLILRFYILFPLQAHNPPIRLRPTPKSRPLLFSLQFFRFCHESSLWDFFFFLRSLSGILQQLPYVEMDFHVRTCEKEKLYNFDIFLKALLSPIIPRNWKDARTVMWRCAAKEAVEVVGWETYKSFWNWIGNVLRRG